MIKAKNSLQRWLPRTAVPLVCIAVLVGCSSDDDNLTTTTPDPDLTVVGDGNGNGIADTFESASTADDANGNGINDVYEAPIESSIVAADTNTNSIDDSFEVSLTGGDDTNSDGVDDAAAAALAGGESCPSDNSEQCELLAQIEDQQALWDASSLDSYVYRSLSIAAGNGEPGCPIVDIPEPLLVTVENGSIVSVGDEVDEIVLARFRTIDQHFDFMRDNVDRLLLTATYSQALGYPTRYRIADPIEDCPSWSVDFDINVCGDDFDCEL